MIMILYIMKNCYGRFDRFLCKYFIKRKHKRRVLYRYIPAIEYIINIIIYYTLIKKKKTTFYCFTQYII